MEGITFAICKITSKCTVSQLSLKLVVAFDQFQGAYAVNFSTLSSPRKFASLAPQTSGRTL